MFKSKLINYTLFSGMILSVLMMSACSEKPEISTKTIKVVTTTTIVGDVVHNIGGEYIDLTILLAPGVDPHSFEPSPNEMANMVDAKLIIANGLGLEEFLEPFIESNSLEEKVVYVSDGIELLENSLGDHDEGHEGDVSEAEQGLEHEYGNIDPHTWVDPNNVIVWVNNITAALIKADPEHSSEYQANADTYKASLMELDLWIRELVAALPEQNRKIVTDHQLFGYYADEYGFIQIGAIIPSFSTGAEASASEIAELEDAIVQYDVKGIFIGNTINPQLAERISQDTGVRLITVYTGSLSDPDGDAPTYLDYIRYNTTVIVTALQ